MYRLTERSSLDMFKIQRWENNISAIHHSTQPLSASSTYEGIIGTNLPKPEVLKTNTETSNSPKLLQILNSFNNPI